MNFDSGWEWGYWLSDVVTARASWDPLLPIISTVSGSTAGGSVGSDGNCMEGVACTNSNSDNSTEDYVLSADIVDGTTTLVDNTDIKIPNTTAATPTAPTIPATTPTTTLPADYEAQQDQWGAFATAIQPFTKLYGPGFSARLERVIVRLSQLQAELLVRGRVDGEESPDLRKLGKNGYA